MRLAKQVQEALDTCGQPWEIKRGSRHLKIVVNGVMAGILPKNGRGPDSDQRACKNLVAQIKRAAKGQKP